MPTKRPTREIYVPPAKARKQKQIPKVPSRGTKRDAQHNHGGGLVQKMERLKIDDMTSRDRYHDSYASHFAHERMLKDYVPILAYQKAILENRHLFRDKIVLDVNCGVGLLSMFAARAGAKHVYAIDVSHSAQLAQRNVEKNNLEKTITVIQGRVNEIKLPVAKVDIIISMFHGQLHEYEESLATIITARDKWLRPSGMMFPDQITLYINALKSDRHKASLQYWNNVYEFDMSVIARKIQTQPFLTQPEEKNVVCEPCKLKVIDLYTTTIEKFARYDAPFRLRMTRSGSLTTLSVYFEIHFTKCHLPLTLSLAPHAPKTHWWATGFLLPSQINVQEKDALYGVFRIVSNATENQSAEYVVDLCMRQPTNLFRKRYSYHLSLD